MSEDDFVLRQSPPLDNEALNALFADAWPSHDRRDFQPVLLRSLTYVTAYRGTCLAGFVNLAWDGGVHGFLLDTTVRREYQRQGLGLRLLRAAEREARARGIEWLHVDFTPELAAFYRAAGFADTAAGLKRVSG